MFCYQSNILKNKDIPLATYIYMGMEEKILTLVTIGDGIIKREDF
jgi:hypothetical protein